MEKLLNKTLSGKMKMGGGEPKSCYRISFVAYTPTFRHSYTVPTGIGSLCNSNVEFKSNLTGVNPTKSRPQSLNEDQVRKSKFFGT